MIVLLSPAKSLDINAVNLAVGPSMQTQPVLAAEAEELVNELKKLPAAKLKALLGVSDGIAK